MSKEWELGFAAGYRACYNEYSSYTARESDTMFSRPMFTEEMTGERKEAKKRRKGKLSAYNKFVKANASKPRFKYKSGSKKGRINMKKIAAAWKKTTTYKKSKKK